jgi:polysaccharide biosynthesis transport protein
MDIAQFIRIFTKNIVLLIAIPLLLAIIVFYLTRNQDKVYDSETVIYTGVTTGYSIESTAQRPTDFFSTSAQFDNMINLINSRQTIVEASIMLLAQNLSLESYNQQYISNENYDKLQKFIPKHVKDMVVKYGRSGVQREKEEQIRSLEREIRSLEREMNRRRNRAALELNDLNGSDEFTPATGLSRDVASNTNGTQGNNTSYAFHTVQPGETLFTISKRYGVSIAKLRELNDLTNQNLTVGQQLTISETTASSSSQGGSKIVNEDYEEFEDDSFIYEPAQHGTLGETSFFTEDGNFSLHMEGATIEKDPIIPRGVRQEDFDKTIQNLTNYYNSSDTNFIYGLLHWGANRHYSIRSIQSSLQIFRITNSDLVRLIYTSDDPGVCQQTLKIIANVFVKNYKLLKANQTDLVVRYFREQVDSADARLQAAEDRLLRFNKRNNIINYAEQTKYIAAQKEDLDLYYQNEQVRMAQSSASLRELETKLTRRDSIYLKSDLINQRRKEYADITERILINELAEDYDQRIGNEIQKLRLRGDQLRDEIKLYVDQLYLYSHSTQGLPIATLLEEWLTNALIYEEAKASLVVLSRRKMDFVRTYQRFAPLGAMLKRIEREITVAEQSYLELLRSLNLALMRQQNLAMATNIRIIDPPFFPLSARPSKAKFLVIAAFLIGLFLVAFIILVLEYFDTSIKSPDRVTNKVGYRLAGAYPLIDSANDQRDMVFVSNRLIELIIQNIKLSINRNTLYPAQKPYLILFFSTQDGVGKTFLAHKIANKLRTYGEKVLQLNYKSHEANSDYDDDYNLSYSYKINDNFVEVKDLQELMQGNVLRRENYNYDYILLELPSIMYHSYPMALMQNVDVSLLVIKASSQWDKADALAVESLNDLLKEPPLTILNEADEFAIDEIISGMKIQRNKKTWKRVKHVITYPSRIRIQVKDNQA